MIAPRGDKLVVHVEATIIDAVPMDREFLAALLRRSHEVERGTFDIELRRAVDKARKEGMENATKNEQIELARARQRYDDLFRSVSDFEKKSGIVINAYNCGRIGDAVKIIMDGTATLDQLKARFENMRWQAADVIAVIERITGNGDVSSSA